MAVALDIYNNPYIADSANNVIRTIQDGIIFPFAGNYIPGYSNDNESALVAALYGPTDVIFDIHENMFIADSLNGRIREVSGGIITSVVGPVTGVPPNYIEGGSATETLLSSPRSVAVDTAGNIYIADSDANRIRKVILTKGIITTYVGSGNPGFSGDGGPALNAQINTPSNIAVDFSGNLYFVDFANARVRKVNVSGTISTVAGNGVGRYSGDGGAAQSAMMSSPSAVATGPGGVFYISDTNNQRVRQVASSGIISTLAGTGAAGYSGDGGAPASAQVDFPGGIAVDSSGANIYFADTVNQRIRKVAGGVITTVAGNGTAGYAGNGAAAVNALLNSPVAVAVDSAENLYIADYNNNVVRKVSVGRRDFHGGRQRFSGLFRRRRRSDQRATERTGKRRGGYRWKCVHRRFRQPQRPESHSGWLHLDLRRQRYAGLFGRRRRGDRRPTGYTRGCGSGCGGNLYIADSGTGTVRLVSAGLILTIAGGGGFGYSGDGGPAVGAQFNSLSGIALDATGNVYLADRGNNAIRFLQLVAPVPSTGVVTNGASNLPGSIAPGEIVTVFGNGIGPQTLTTSTPVNGVIPTEVAGATVYIGGIPAPILYTWTNQASVVVPYEVTPGKAAVTVAYNGQVSLELPVQVTPTAPGLFTMDQSGQGQAVALNENGVVNSTSTPVAEGTVIIVYMTGAGLVDPTVPDGTFANVQPLLPVTATLGGQSVDVQFVTGAYT